MPSQGPRYPGTIATEVGPSGDNDWLNPANVGADDATEAQITAATYDANDHSYRLKATNFGFTVPTGATITGIVVEIDRRAFAGAAEDQEVRLYNGAATLVGDDKQTATAWPTTSGIASYGGSADTWSASLTDADINDPDFGVALIVLATAANTDIGVDFIRVTVHYTGGTIEQAVSGALSFAGEVVKRVSRSLAGALDFTGEINKRTERSLAGSASFTGTITKQTARGQTATLTFTTNFSPELLAPGTPALVIIHIHTE